MFLLGMGLGRSKGLILNHIFLGITALLLMSGVAHASDGEDLLKAAYAGDLAQVRALLEKGADIDHQAQTGATALIIASQEGHEEIVQVLLARGAEIDLQAEFFGTALITASQNGHEGIVQALLAKGAEINHQNKKGSTALIIASQEGHEGIVQALLAEGAEIDHQAKNGWTALMIVSEKGHGGSCKPCWTGAEIRKVRQCLSEGHEGIVQALLAKGANVELRAIDGATALKKAKTQQIKQLLRAAGATQ